MLQRSAPPPPSGPPPPSLGDSPSRLDLQRWAAAADERDAQRRLADENIERLQRIRLDAAVSAPLSMPLVEWAGLEQRQQLTPQRAPPHSAASSAGLFRPPADPRWTPPPLRRPSLSDAQTTETASNEAAARENERDAEFKRPEGAAAAPSPHQPPQSPQHRGPTIPATHDPLLRPPPDGEFKSSATESEAERREGEQPEAKRTKLTHPRAAVAQPLLGSAAQLPPPPPVTVRLQEHKEEEPLTRGQTEWPMADG